MNLTAGNEGTGFEFNSTFSIFAITITLTESGFQNVDKVTEAVFGYLSMLRSEPANERIFNEIKRIEDLDFEYGPEEQPTDNVETLCSNMQWYPPEKYLTGTNDCILNISLLNFIAYLAQETSSCLTLMLT